MWSVMIDGHEMWFKICQVSSGSYIQPKIDEAGSWVRFRSWISKRQPRKIVGAPARNVVVAAASGLRACWYRPFFLFFRHRQQQHLCYFPDCRVEPRDNQCPRGYTTVDLTSDLRCRRSFFRFMCAYRIGAGDAHAKQTEKIIPDQQTTRVRKIVAEMGVYYTKWTTLNIYPSSSVGSCTWMLLYAQGEMGKCGRWEHWWE